MLIGHLGVGLAAKKLDSRIPLWLLLVAAIFVDLINCLFLFTGVEIVRVAPGFTKWVPLELVSIPYSHSLAMQLLWALVFSAGVIIVTQRNKIQHGAKLAVLLGGVVLAHYFCDVIVHVPDLALWPGSVKLGLGLWNYPIISNTIEISFFLGGLFLYLSALDRKGSDGIGLIITFVVINISLQLVSGFIPPYTTNVAVVSANLLFTFLFLIALGWLLERKLHKAGK